MPTTITSAGITFNDATSQTTSALAANAIGTTQIAANAVTAAKLGANEQKQICKAWINFGGTGTIGQPQTIRSSYNVSSITKNGTGDYTVNFATVMVDTNYVTLVTGSSFVGATTGYLGYEGDASTSVASGRTVSAVRIGTTNTSAANNSLSVNVAIFGN